MRSEHSLEIYTFENTVFRILRKRYVSELRKFDRHGVILCHRVPRYSHEILTRWYQQGDPVHTSRMMKYMLDRTIMVLKLLDVSETVTKTAYVHCPPGYPSLLSSDKPNREFARVFGVDWFSVISRGSQFKVESFMFRIAKPESLVLLSPSKDDVRSSYFPRSRNNVPICVWFRLEGKTPLVAYR